MPDLRACRMGDFVATKCNKVPPGVFARGSYNSFVNNRPQVRLLDFALPGPGKAISGSTNTFVNNKPAVRVKDKVICGKIIGGSFNTFIR